MYLNLPFLTINSNFLFKLFPLCMNLILILCIWKKSEFLENCCSRKCHHSVRDEYLRTRRVFAGPLKREKRGEEKEKSSEEQSRVPCPTGDYIHSLF